MKSLLGTRVTDRRVLVRVDFNVFPIKPFEPRILKTIPTLRYLIEKRAKVIVATHLETNRGETPSVRGLAAYLKRSYFPSLKFFPHLAGPRLEKRVAELPGGGILLLENLRKERGEKNLSRNFSKNLANLADVYVNEAFSTSHRLHSSIVLVPKFLPGFAGFLFEREVKTLSEVFRPSRPFTLILAGGKVETKLPLLRRMQRKADTILLGGMIANLFLEKRLFHKGRSRFSLRKILLPEDAVVARYGKRRTLGIEELKRGDRIFDLGPKTLHKWEDVIKKSKLVVWNGPLGYIEKGFLEGTATLVSILKKSRARIIIGGGDTTDCLPKKLPKNIFVSTGGGAMLEFLAKGTLPGIEALKTKDYRLPTIN